MWIVLLALRRPYTFIVTSMLVAITGVLAILRMPTDIFPNVDIPVISVIFNYSGMPAEEMEKRIVANFERFLTTTVSDIEHIESQSLTGVSVIKVYFQPSAKIEAATAQVAAIAQSATRNMPPGTQPPNIIRYSASSVPILQIALSSETMSEQQIFDAATNGLRPQLIVIPGIQIPGPYGGKQRQIMVDLDPEKLYAWGLSASDVSNAVSAQNLVIPAGSVKIGAQEHPVRVNSSPNTIAEFNDLPIRTIRGTTVRIGDVASVRDGYAVQTNVVYAQGKRGVLLSVFKSGSASTLDVVSQVRARLPGILATLPPELKADLLFDQSLFVRASIEGVVKEAIIAAGLTGLMILIFLGSWRSTLIVVVSIPLSILTSIITLWALGQTLNVMTLGGMALAVGILVDDATVEIENIHRNLHEGKELVRAILDGASQIAVPAFVSTLCICVVFVPVAFISGAARFLFTPMALAVVFAMLTSYLLSRTLVPTLVHHLLASEVERYGGKRIAVTSQGEHAAQTNSRSRSIWRVVMNVTIALLLLAGGVAAVWWLGLGGTSRNDGWIARGAIAMREHFQDDPRRAARYGAVLGTILALLWAIARFDLLWRSHAWFNARFESLRLLYGSLLAWSLHYPKIVVALFALLLGGSCLLLSQIGRDFFPSVDAGLIRLHVRAPAGTRIEETQRYFAPVERVIRRVIPPEQITTMLSNIGIPNSGINLSLSDGTVMSAADGEILVGLSADRTPTQDHIDALRVALRQELPNLTCFFKPADIVTQVLNFGLPAAIDVQISGPQSNNAANLALARQIIADLRAIPGASDVRLAQVTQTPDLRIAVDRTLASQVGVTQREVASDLLISLSSSGQGSPNYWLSPANGVNYSILVQTPQYALSSLADLQSTPITLPGNDYGNEPVQLLGNLATFSRGTSATNVLRYNIQQTINVQLGVTGADLGGVAQQVRRVLDSYKPKLARGSTIELRGQIESMDASFKGMALGLVFAVLLVYLLMVINFQSWLDPLIILMALPGALAGILWMLYATQTTISVPALMGAMMSIGVATANSILMITFANDQRRAHNMSARDAALSAGMVRLRPVIMTALAMIVGMLPMAIGVGEGGEQNAPLGRAVVGGLAFATATTLFLVPVVYSLLRWRQPAVLQEDLR